MTPMHSVAADYVAKGWPVFPCRPAPEDVVDPSTGEITTQKEKTPLTPRGLKDATTTSHIIKAWWGRKYPEAMVGIPTGEPIGAWVLDIDVQHDGHITLAALLDEHGDLPATLSASTPSGGTHYYFKHQAGVRNRGAVGEGVDVRGDGGYVISPGSVMADGRSYRWDNDLEPAEAPAWLLALVVKQAPVSTAATHQPSRQIHDAYVSAAVDGELSSLAAEPMGNRNNALNDAAFKLGTLVGAGALREAEARDMLQHVARQWGRDWSQCVKTIDNGLSAGMRQPRVLPESDQRPDNDNTRLVDVSRMIANGLARAEAVDTLKQEDDSSLSSTTKDLTVLPDPLANLAVRATAFEWRDPKTIPRREFVYGQHLIRKYVSVTSAPGGLGKTSLSVAEACAMASGKPLLGTPVPNRLKVWLWNLEDPRDEMERRIMAACLHFKLKPADIAGHLFLDTGREQELIVAYEDKKTGVRINEPIVEAVVAHIKHHQIDVVCIDPFVSTHSVNENDNGAIDKVAKLWAQIADDTNCAVDVVHHVKKTGDREATIEDSRGAVSLLAAARSARILNRMSEDQARDAGVPKDERFGYFSVAYGKANLSKMSGSADWRKLVSVPLGNGGNGNLGFHLQDHAAVVTEWKMPTAEQIAEKVPDDVLAKVKVMLDNGMCRESDQASSWAGRDVAAALGKDITEDSVKREVKALLRHWKSEGDIKVVTLMDPIRKEAKPFLKSGDWAA